MMRRGARTRDERGQGLVEFTIIVPVFVLLLLGMLEFGFVFDHTLTIQYASREGARVGSALADGGKLGCDSVDPMIIAAVTRVLKSPGSRVNIAEVPTIRVFKADASGNEVVGLVNVWNYNAGTGLYTQASVGWRDCTRKNFGDKVTSPDSIGVSLTYTYRFQTALGSVLRFFGGSGWSSLTVSDRTVMALNPTN